MELIPWANRSWPIEIFQPCTYETTSWFELTANQKTHSQGGSVPATGSKPSEKNILCCCFVKVERLWIELGGKLSYLFCRYAEGPGSEDLSR